MGRQLGVDIHHDGDDHQLLSMKPGDQCHQFHCCTTDMCHEKATIQQLLVLGKLTNEVPRIQNFTYPLFSKAI